MTQPSLFDIEENYQGWAPTRQGMSRTDAKYKHSSGWMIVHCGHMTALRPYYALSPDGAEVFDDSGRGWRTVDEAKHDLYTQYGVSP